MINKIPALRWFICHVMGAHSDFLFDRIFPELFSKLE